MSGCDCFACLNLACVTVFISVFDKLKKLILAEMPTTYEMPNAAVEWVAKVGRCWCCLGLFP